MVCRLTYEARSAVAKNSVAKLCFEIMARKRTNLAVAADVATADEMLQLAEATGPHICVFKTHVDIFDRWAHHTPRRGGKAQLTKHVQGWD